jgi:hypothetical protein
MNMAASEPVLMAEMCETQPSRKRSSSWRFWTVAILMLTVCAVVAGFVIRDWCYSPLAALEAKNIQSIQVRLFNFHGDSITYLVKDQETITKILDAMKPASFDWNPALWQKYGWFYVTFTDGTMIGVSVYQTYHEASAFSIGGKYYRGGSEAKLHDILNSEGKRIGVKETRESKKKS